MRALPSIIVGAALLVLAPMPALAHHKPNHPDFPRHEQAAARAPDPCDAARNNPRESNARLAMQQRCRHLRAQLRERPYDATLREECDRFAQRLTGRSC